MKELFGILNIKSTVTYSVNTGKKQKKYYSFKSFDGETRKVSFPSVTPNSYDNNIYVAIMDDEIGQNDELRSNEQPNKHNEIGTLSRFLGVCKNRKDDMNFWLNVYGLQPPSNKHISKQPMKLLDVFNHVIRDQCHFNTFSIDNSDTIDIDDACSIRDNKLYVHIALVAYRLNEPLYEYAKNQMFTVYTENSKISMIPNNISQELSLKENEERLAMTFEYDIIKNQYINLQDVKDFNKVWENSSNSPNSINDIIDLKFNSVYISKIINNKKYSYQEFDNKNINPQTLNIIEVIKNKYSHKLFNTEMNSKQFVECLMILVNYTTSDLIFKYYDKSIVKQYNDEWNGSLSRNRDSHLSVISNSSLLYDYIPDAVINFHNYLDCNYKGSKFVISETNDGYAQITSPIRRFMDIINQELIMNVLLKIENKDVLTYTMDYIIEKINDKSKNIKRFYKKKKYLQIYYNLKGKFDVGEDVIYNGYIVAISPEKKKYYVYIPKIDIMIKHYLKNDDNKKLFEKLKVQLVPDSKENNPYNMINFVLV